MTRFQLSDQIKHANILQEVGMMQYWCSCWQSNCRIIHANLVGTKFLLYSLIILLCLFYSLVCFFAGYPDYLTEQLMMLMTRLHLRSTNVTFMSQSFKSRLRSNNDTILETGNKAVEFVRCDVLGDSGVFWQRHLLKFCLRLPPQNGCVLKQSSCMWRTDLVVLGGRDKK